MRRFLLFVCVLLIQGEVYSEDFGLFKNSWNTILINKQVSIEDFSRGLVNSSGGEPSFEELLASKTSCPTVDVLVRSVTFKLINVESKNWQEALQGRKIRHCAVKVDADLNKISEIGKGYVCLKFFDHDGILVRSAFIVNGKMLREYQDSVEISVSEIKSGAPIKILFLPDASCGAPVRVEVE